MRDRLVHHAVYRVLYPFFAKRFICDSYSCQLEKGTHRALARFRSFAQKVSHNNTRTCWVLKCDIRKFFANIDQQILERILEKHISDTNTLWLLHEIIRSFYSSVPGKGLPLGNLTSQLLVNIYMNEFDKFVKHRLKMKWYIRYADDFVFLSENCAWLESLIPIIGDFLKTQLELELHPNKIFLKTLASGLDFLGWVHFPDHRVLRTTAKRRMFKRAAVHPTTETMASYRGLLQHGNTNKLQETLAQFGELPDHPKP